MVNSVITHHSKALLVAVCADGVHTRQALCKVGVHWRARHLHTKLLLAARMPARGHHHDMELPFMSNVIYCGGSMRRHVSCHGALEAAHHVNITAPGVLGEVPRA